MLRHESVDSRDELSHGYKSYKSKMDAAIPFPASPLTSPDTIPPSSISPCIFPVEPPSPRNTPSPSIMTQTPDPPARTSSPSMMTQTPIETRSLNSSNSKDSSGCQPCSENLDSKGEAQFQSRIQNNFFHSGTSEDSGSARGCYENLSPQVSPTSRQKIRRQSTAYDECLNQRSCGPPHSGSNRRGSRPFLSPGK